MKVDVTTKLSDPKLMAWDTTHWGVPVGHATHLHGLSEWAQENTVGMISLLIDTDRPHEAQLAEEQGFRFMDVRVTLARRTARRSHTCRLAYAEDAARLKDIARTAFRTTRFYADPRLDDLLCDELYVEWTRSLCAGAADAVLVAERDEVPVGYVTVSAGSEIGLIAVADDYRGQYIGSGLVAAATDWAHMHSSGQIRVATQARNLGALRTFESCGFRVERTQLWFHKWYT